jgi:hypothetical protein
MRGFLLANQEPSTPVDHRRTDPGRADEATPSSRKRSNCSGGSHPGVVPEWSVATAPGKRPPGAHVLVVDSLNRTTALVAFTNAVKLYPVPPPPLGLHVVKTTNHSEPVIDAP